jgi:hypothetical protein
MDLEKIFENVLREAIRPIDIKYKKLTNNDFKFLYNIINKICKIDPTLQYEKLKKEMNKTTVKTPVFFSYYNDERYYTDDNYDDDSYSEKFSKSGYNEDGFTREDVKNIKKGKLPDTIRTDSIGGASKDARLRQIDFWVSLPSFIYDCIKDPITVFNDLKYLYIHENIHKQQHSLRDWNPCKIGDKAVENRDLYNHKIKYYGAITEIEAYAYQSAQHWKGSSYTELNKTIINNDKNAFKYYTFFGRKKDKKSQDIWKHFVYIFNKYISE